MFQRFSNPLNQHNIQFSSSLFPLYHACPFSLVFINMFCFITLQSNFVGWHLIQTLTLSWLELGVTASFWFQVFGFLTKPLVRYLAPHQQNNRNSNKGSKTPKEDLTVPLLSFEESTSTNLLRAKDSLSMLIESPIYTIHSYWRKFDDTYMRPVFGGPLSSRSEC